MALAEEHTPMYPANPRPGSAAGSVDHQAQLEHLLKVTDSIVQDANATWADLWSEFRQCVDRNGQVLPKAQSFLPSCGWEQFLEKVWLLKHYLDSIHRVCDGRGGRPV
jgi:hypothetical protein